MRKNAYPGFISVGLLRLIFKISFSGLFYLGGLFRHEKIELTSVDNSWLYSNEMS